MGHFMTGANGAGAAFTVSSIAVVAGTVVGWYYVLPDAVQFDELDYINDSFQEIEDAWMGESIASFLPSAGVLIGGAIVHGILAEIAAESAGERAREQIETGAKRFEPEPFIYPDPRGRLILGARIGL